MLPILFSECSIRTLLKKQVFTVLSTSKEKPAACSAVSHRPRLLTFTSALCFKEQCHNFLCVPINAAVANSVLPDCGILLYSDLLRRLTSVFIARDITGETPLLTTAALKNVPASPRTPSTPKEFSQSRFLPFFHDGDLCLFNVYTDQAARRRAVVFPINGTKTSHGCCTIVVTCFLCPLRFSSRSFATSTLPRNAALCNGVAPSPFFYIHINTVFQSRVGTNFSFAHEVRPHDIADNRKSIVQSVDIFAFFKYSVFIACRFAGASCCP